MNGEARLCSFTGEDLVLSSHPCCTGASVPEYVNIMASGDSGRAFCCLNIPICAEAMEVSLSNFDLGCASTPGLLVNSETDSHATG